MIAKSDDASRTSLTHEPAQDEIELQCEGKLVAEDWIVLRTPVLPFDAWLTWTSHGNDRNGMGAQATNDEDIAGSKRALRDRLGSVLTPAFIEALYLASPSLTGSLDTWLQNGHGSDAQAVETSLVAYFTRMAGRPTPFGLFSAVSLGTVGKASNFGLCHGSSYRRRTQISFPYLRRLYESALSLPQVREVIRYVPNPTIRVRDGRIHYLKRVSDSDGKTRLLPASCSHTPTLAQVLALSDAGTTPPEIVRHLIDGSGAQAGAEDDWLAQASNFTSQLIEAQILCPMIGPVVSGRDPAECLLEDTRNLGDLKSVRETLTAVSTGLSQLDSEGVGTPVDRYDALARRLLALDKNGETPAAELFFVDLEKPEPHFSLGSNVVDEVLRGIELLSAISAGNDPTWERFTHKFMERFGDAQVPVLDLFDGDLDFRFDDALAGAEPWKQREIHLTQLVTDAISEQRTVIELSGPDVATLRRDEPGRLPSCFAVLGSMAAVSEAEVERGNYQVSIDGISRAVGLLGRFAGLGEHWGQKILSLAKQEQAAHPEVIFADVAYDPPGNPTSNIICRPSLTEYVIPFLGTTSAPRSKQIRLSELLVGVRGQDVVLWSTRLGRQVIPVHNSAYAFHHSENPTLLRFLCKLAMGTANVAWDWGKVLESFSFLPRLQHGRLVITRARWIIRDSDLLHLRSARDTDLMDGIRRLRLARRIPRFASLLDADKRLPIDLENVLSVRMLLKLSAQQKTLRLAELLPGPEQLCVHGPDGRFQHEFIVPVRSVAPKVAEPLPVRACGPRTPAFAHQRTLLPNSEWMYVKVYMRPSSVETFLTGPFSGLLHRLAAEKIVQKWFFIRYTDPYHHLRLRFHLLQSDLAPDLFRLTGTYLNHLQKESLWKWEVGSYEREVERYGGLSAMHISETVFCADSVMALKCLESFATAKDREECSKALCMISIDRMMDDFGLPLSMKLACIADLCRRLQSGRDDQKKVRIQCDQEMRAERRTLLSGISRSGERLSRHLDDRSSILRLQAHAFAKLQEQEVLTRPVLSLLQDFVHLSINRLSKATKSEEWKLYYRLHKLYKSCHAQGLTSIRELGRMQAQLRFAAGNRNFHEFGSGVEKQVRDGAEVNPADCAVE